MEGQTDSEPARSDTERAVALAHLLHEDCKHLLRLYKERESFLTHHVPEGERLVVFNLCQDNPTSAEQVSRAHAALRWCLDMLKCMIGREVEEMGEELEGEYESVRKMVKDRIGHLLHSTGALLESGGSSCASSSEFPFVQGLDEEDGSGSFAAKLFTYRVLLELIHWSDSASRALHLLHSEKQSVEDKQEL